MTQMLSKKVSEQANPLQELQIEIASLKEVNKELERQVSLLRNQLEWFKRQTFGKKSEKRFPEELAKVLPMFPDDDFESKPEDAVEENIEVKSHERKTRGKTEEIGTNKDSGLRFDDNVEIVEEHVYPKEVKGLDTSEYAIIGKEYSDRLATRVSKNYVHRRIFYKVKIKESSEIKQASVSPQVLNKSYLSASFLVSMIVDKCLYSIPIFRQHQRLKLEGIHIARNTLTTNFNKTCQIFGLLNEPQRFSIMLSRVLAIDETPMKVGVDKAKHKMHKGYVWPIIGDKKEIIFNYDPSRAASVLNKLLANFKGVILSDGYVAYKSYIEGVNESNLSADITQASCWVHARRKFVKLENQVKEIHNKALSLIGSLYQIEDRIKAKQGSEVLYTRQKESSAIVDDYFNWLRSFSGSSKLATNEDLRKAVCYSLEREESMRVFLRNPEVSLDTNHLEREIRPIAIGRKNWMFCWTETGAESLCTAQTLIRTCLLQGINPTTYLTDVLQRLVMERKPEDDLSDLIPRLWKETYADKPLKCPSQLAIEQFLNDKT